MRKMKKKSFCAVFMAVVLLSGCGSEIDNQNE